MQITIAKSHVIIGLTYLAIARSQVIMIKLEQVVANVKQYFAIKGFNIEVRVGKKKYSMRLTRDSQQNHKLYITIW